MWTLHVVANCRFIAKLTESILSSYDSFTHGSVSLQKIFNVALNVCSMKFLNLRWQT